MPQHIDVTIDTADRSPSRWRVYQRAKDYGVYDPQGVCRVTIPRSPSTEDKRALWLAQRICRLICDEKLK